jgi:hypothetical protein
MISFDAYFDYELAHALFATEAASRRSFIFISRFKNTTYRWTLDKYTSA